MQRETTDFFWTENGERSGGAASASSSTRPAVVEPSAMTNVCLQSEPPTAKQVPPADLAGVHVRQFAPAVPTALPHVDTQTQSILDVMVMRPSPASVSATTSHVKTFVQAPLTFIRKRRSSVFSQEQCQWLAERFAASKLTMPPSNDWCHDALTAGGRLKTETRLLMSHNVKRIRQYLRTHAKSLSK